MQSALSFRGAEITTATVQVNTLTLAGKQMTLAVYRQIPIEWPINRDGTMRGDAWGTVNYHDSECSKHEIEYKTHLHVVWLKDGELRRQKVGTGEPGQPRHFRPFNSEAADRFLSASWCEQGHSTIFDWAMLRHSGHCRMYEFEIAGITCEANAPSMREGHECPPPGASSLAAKELHDELSVEAARRERWPVRIAELRALPQLYIAV